MLKASRFSQNLTSLLQVHPTRGPKTVSSIRSEHPTVSIVIGRRIAALWFIAILAGGLSPILAYLISLLGGKFGITAWSWIFVGISSSPCSRDVDELF